MKNSSHPMGNRSRDLPTSNTLPQPNTLSYTPLVLSIWKIKIKIREAGKKTLSLVNATAKPASQGGMKNAHYICKKYVNICFR